MCLSSFAYTMHRANLSYMPYNVYIYNPYTYIYIHLHSPRCWYSCPPLKFWPTDGLASFALQFSSKPWDSSSHGRPKDGIVWVNPMVVNPFSKSQIMDQVDMIPNLENGWKWSYIQFSSGMVLYLLLIRETMPAKSVHKSSPFWTKDHRIRKIVSRQSRWCCCSIWIRNWNDFKYIYKWLSEKSMVKCDVS